jgi:hypothetical protein
MVSTGERPSEIPYKFSDYQFDELTLVGACHSSDQLVESFCQMSLKEWNDILQCSTSFFSYSESNMGAREANGIF